jgi:hypothetical protein
MNINFKYDRGDRVECISRSYPWLEGEIYTINTRYYTRGTPWYIMEGKTNWIMDEGIMEPYDVIPFKRIRHEFKSINNKT